MNIQTTIESVPDAPQIERSSNALLTQDNIHQGINRDRSGQQNIRGAFNNVNVVNMHL
jgi:hypothetical protein